ncbi:MAG: flagellar export chaperone FlgN [Syntrophobacteraceae bacterium]
MKECAQHADEIIGLLEEESSALVSFNGALLMQLLPRKEHLFNAIKERIECLSEGKGPASGAVQDSTRDSLREQLQRIQRLNETNRVFIENTLLHYQDFLNCLCPSGYGRGQEGRPERAQVAMRGVAFKKEI